jgi:hypothetical protein
MSGKDVDIEHWSRIAAEWTAWARAPNHDAFWAYRASLLAFIGWALATLSMWDVVRGGSRAF